MNLKSALTILTLLFSVSFSSVASEQLSEEERAYFEWAQQTWDSIVQRTGEINVEGAPATLQIGDDFYYVDAKDAETILVDVWGNPPGQRTLGMIFPTGTTPFEPDSWAVTIQYEEDGYVSDADAEDIDYSELLVQMKSDTQESSKERVASGYEAVELIGWASTPHYDAESNKLHWAKELKFGNSDIHTLNYNIRVLGRKGVLVLNYIANMDQLNLIESNLDSILNMARFDAGSKYSEFDPSVDEVAAYGLGALVAGKALGKTGFLAAALMALKKFWAVIAVAIVAFFKKIMGRSKKPSEQENAE